MSIMCLEMIVFLLTLQDVDNYSSERQGKIGPSVSRFYIHTEVAPV